MEFTPEEILEFCRTRANIIRQKYIEDMENKLTSFDRKMKEKGYQVFWISDEAELTETVFSLLPKNHYNKVCFDLPNVPEDLRSSKSIRPVHYADVESGKTGASYLFVQADFAIVETGTLVLLNKNSKNCLNSIPNLFVLLDISKLLNKASDLETILYLRTHAHEQQYLPEDVKLINRPFSLIEPNFSDSSQGVTHTPVQITIFLYDNGVTDIMQNSTLRESLYCIDCDKCKTVCPMYEYTKEHTPIHIVRDNFLHHATNTEHIIKNAMLCGNCDQVCPVQIPICNLILKEIELARQSHPGKSRLANTFDKRKKLNKMNGKINRWFFNKTTFGKNKMLYNYFKQQQDPFYNILWMQENNENDK